jgi:hypothetical protein
MTPRTMTEPEAWREIARRITHKGWNAHGLNSDVQKLLWQTLVTTETAQAMVSRVAMHEARALAALWLALEAEEEGA